MMPNPVTRRGLSDDELSPYAASNAITESGGTLAWRSDIGPQAPKRVVIVESCLLWPDWAKSTVDEFFRLLDLRPNWDSYGAPAIHATSVETAMSLLLEVMHDDTEPPTVIPTSSGGVQLEWHARGIDLEVEVGPTGSIQVYGRDHQTNEEWSGSLPGQTQSLGRALARLSG
jgi:hypothetical protein